MYVLVYRVIVMGLPRLNLLQVKSSILTAINFM